MNCLGLVVIGVYVILTVALAGVVAFGGDRDLYTSQTGPW